MPVQRRCKLYSFDTRMGIHRVNAGDVAEHPFLDGAVSIMVHTVHADAGNRTVRKKGIPAFPDGSCTKLNLIKPSRKFLVQQQFVGKIIHAVVGEHIVQQWCSDKSRLQFVVTLLKQLQKLPFCQLFVL